MKNKILNITFYLFMLLTLASCFATPNSPFGVSCIGNAYNSVPTVNNYEVALPATSSGWVSSNATVNEGDQIEMYVTGTITTCAPFTQTINLDSTTSPIFVQNGGSNLELNPNDVVIVSINSINTSEPNYVYYGTNTNQNCSNGGSYDNGCKSTEGMGMNVEINGKSIKSPDYQFPLLSTYISSASSGINLSLYQYTNSYLLSNLSTQYALVSSAPTGGSLKFEVMTGEGTVTGGYSLKVQVVDQTLECVYNNGVTSNTSSAVGTVSYSITSNSTGPSSGDAVYPISNGEIGVTSIGQAQLSAPASGTIWMKINGAVSSGNGSYVVALGTFIASVFDPIISSINIAATGMFNGMNHDGNFIQDARSLLILYVVMYALFYLMGMVEVNQLDLAIRVAKIGTIITLLQPNSLYIFNTYFLNLFTAGAANLLAAITNVPPDNPAGLFGFIDSTMNQFFNQNVWLQLSSLLPLLVGFAYIPLIIYAASIFASTLAEAFVGYMFAVLGVGMLIGLAPIFISLILFSKTREMFDNWLKYIANFSLQPVFLFTLLCFINEIAMIAFRNLMDFQVCWGVIWSLVINWNIFFDWLGLGIDIPSTSLISAYWYVLSSSTGIGLFGNVFVYLLFVFSFRSVLELVPDMVDALTQVTPGGATQTTGGNSKAREVTKDAANSLKTMTGTDEKSKQRREGEPSSKEESKESAPSSKEKSKESAPSSDGKSKESAPSAKKESP